MRIQKPNIGRILKWSSVGLIFLFGGCTVVALRSMEPLETTTGYVVVFGWLTYVAWDSARTLFGVKK